MRLRSVGPMLVALVALVGSLIAAPPARGQERFGGLAGTVTDSSLAPVPGATITVTNQTSRTVRTGVSGADGGFRFPDLEPGRYMVTVELQGFQKVSADDVLVLLGRTASFTAKLEVGAVTETVDVTADAARQIDMKSATVLHNVTEDEFDRLPKTRSFQGLAVTSPSVSQGQIEGGFQVNGASNAENSFTVDGVVTNSLVNGKSRQDTVFEYLQEVQVKTAGIEAEYGGALGGVISAVTKSGGNAFHGEGHYFFDGNALSAGPVKRLVLDPSDENNVGYIQDANQKNNRSEVGGSLGGPIVKNHLFFFASVSPRFVERTNNYDYASGTDPGSVDQSQIYTQGFAKLTYANGRVQSNASLLLTPSRSTGALAAYDGFGPNDFVASKAGNAANITRGFNQNQTNASGNVDVWLSSAAFVSLRGGYFYDSFNDTGIPNTTAVVWNNAGAIGLAGLPAALQQPRGFQNTPRVEITKFDTTKQGFVQADYNHVFDAAGSHVLKGGAGFRRVINDVDNSYPGGYVLLNWDTSLAASASAVGGRGTYGYYEVDNFGTTGQAGSNIWSLFIQDQWTATPRLTFNIGVRTENEKVPSFRPEVKKNAIEFGFGDKIAPRLAGTFDVTGSGRLKLFASWGRYFDWTKYDLPRGSFGGDVWDVYYRALDTTDVFSLNLNNKPGADLWQPTVANSHRDRRVPSIDAVDPDIKPMYQDSTNVGLEYQWSATTEIGAHYIHNNMPRTIEDIGGILNGDEVYFIANPGEGIATINPISGATAPFPSPKPKRQYDALELTVNRRFSKGWFGSASYTYSRLYGNYAGLANSDEIDTPTTGTTSAVAQQQTGEITRPGGNANRAWDVDEILWDSHGNLDVLGRLATDRPHVVKLYGAYSLPFGTQIGGLFYAGSGTPMSTYVNTANQTEVFVNGRGDMGRTPFLTRTDLLVSHELRMAQNRRIRLELNIINLFNQKTATHIFNFLNKGAGLPRPDAAIDLSDVDLAKGYDYNALILATPLGSQAYDVRYGQPDLFQTGLQGQFSVRFIF